VKYYLACKVGLILSILIPTVVNIPLPFSPIQIIILELFMDLAAASSFVNEPTETDVLKRKSRNPKENFMNKRMVFGIFSGGITLAAIVLSVYLFSWFSGDTANAGVYAFIAWLFGHVCLAFNMRTETVPLIKSGVFKNNFFNVWLIGVVAFLVAALNLPVLSGYLQLSPVGIMPALYLAGIAIIATAWIEIPKLAKRR
jgi:Ca2+-transporting ATPase